MIKKSFKFNEKEKLIVLSFFLLQDIKKAISNLENLIVHNHCLQFRTKVRNSNNTSHANGNVNNNNNETHVSGAVIDDGVVLSDLFNKLHSLTVGRGITYTITECLLDQVSSNRRLKDFSTPIGIADSYK